MTKIDAAVEAIQAAGYDQMAKDFRRLPEYREKIALIVRLVERRADHADRGSASGRRAASAGRQEPSRLLTDRRASDAARRPEPAGREGVRRMEWTTTPPTKPGRYRVRMLSDGRDDGVHEVQRATQGGRSVLVASWAGKWHNVEDFRREWLGPLDD